MSRVFDVVIVGAGVVGSLMASALIARNLARPSGVAIIAAQRPEVVLPADIDWDLRVFALNRASQRLLDACGIWRGLQPRLTCAYERMCVWDAGGEPGGAGSLQFDCAETGEPNLGHIVDGRMLQAHCAAESMRSGVVLLEGGLSGIVTDQDGVTLQLRDGRNLQTRLLIAADGPESRARELLGIDTGGHSYHQDALVAHVRTQQPHRNTAWQRFLSTGPVALLPLTDGRSSMVWSVAREEAARLRRLAPTEFGAALTAALGEALGTCELTTPVVGFPLQMQYALRYTAPRAVLIGDAAHVVHPLAGQGLNLGMLDCATLAAVLGTVKGGAAFDESRLLRRYERQRRSDNFAIAAALDALERLFSSRSPVLSTLRRTGLGITDRMPSLKRRLTARALGLSGDVPVLNAPAAGG